MKKLSYRAAFTLIELLVVISIIGFLMTLAFTNYNRFNDQQIVRQAAEEMKVNLRLAAARAKNNEKDCTVCGGSDNDCATFTPGDDLALYAWCINLLIDPPTIFGKCEEDEDFPIPPVSIDIGGVNFSWTPADVERIEFYPPGGGPDNQGGTNLDEPLVITFSKTGASDETITINPSGNVE